MTTPEPSATAEPQYTYQIDNSLYINLCNRCTLRCQFCPKTHDQWQLHQYDLSLPRSPRVEEILASIIEPERYDEIVFCGFGEPTLRLKALIEIARNLSATPTPIRVNSDGLANLVYGRNILPELKGIIQKWSISLNAQNEEVYRRHCQPTLADAYEHVKTFISLASRDFDVTATAIDGLPGVDIEACAHLSHQLGARFRARTLDQLG